MKVLSDGGPSLLAVAAAFLASGWWTGHEMKAHKEACQIHVRSDIAELKADVRDMDIKIDRVLERLPR